MPLRAQQLTEQLQESKTHSLMCQLQKDLHHLLLLAPYHFQRTRVLAPTPEGQLPTWPRRSRESQGFVRVEHE